jgi:hypothetical protein
VGVRSADHVRSEIPYSTTSRKEFQLMAVTPVAQPSRDSLVAIVANRALDVLKDAGFQRVLRQEGWRFLVSVSAEARAAWLRTAEQ